MIVCTLVVMIGCKKTEETAPPVVPVVTHCADCEERKTHYQPAEYCGTESQVDLYVSELYKAGRKAGQDWFCTIHPKK